MNKVNKQNGSSRGLDLGDLVSRICFLVFVTLAPQLTFLETAQALELNQAAKMDLLQAQMDEEEDTFNKAYELLQQVSLAP